MSDERVLRWECTDDEIGESDPPCGDIMFGGDVIAQQVDKNFGEIICHDVNLHDELVAMLKDWLPVAQSEIDHNHDCPKQHGGKKCRSCDLVALLARALP